MSEMELQKNTLGIKDIKGKLFPGMIILLNIAIIFFHQNDIYKSEFVELYKNYKVVIVSLILIFAYTLGEVNSFLTFQLRVLYDKFFSKNLTLDKFLEKGLKENSKETLLEELKEIFKKNFGKDSLNKHYWKFHYICREAYLNKYSEGYKHTKEITSQVFFSMGMILPLLILGLTFIFLIPNNIFILVLGLGSIVSSIVFLINGEKRRKEEAFVIFLNYYYYQKNNEK